MIHIRTMTLGLYQTNCYIVHSASSNRCVVIDPGYEAHTIMDALEKLELELEAIFLTHGHFDHVGAVRDLVATTGCRVYICAEDTTLPPQLTAGPLFYTDEYPSEGKLQVAGMDFTIVHTAGHTPGSVCILVEDAMFSGDTLFAGSMGRCDLPGSSIFEMRKSLRKLCALGTNYRVFPGHGADSTLDHEKKTNPYLR
ncbi:MAG: MBL fold metallo-hydrolase [Oscillospiraceae bacterium]|nr:MBL fold metallo-hydrolase [Oscillospiraceae bacterium]